MHSSPGITVIKIGGRCAEDAVLMANLADELLPMHSSGEKILLVHGGGTTISRLQKQFGIEPSFVQGLRKTSPEEMPQVDMALAGAVNKHLVRLCINRGLPAWGISGVDGSILIGKSTTGDAGTNRTGSIQSVSTAPIEHLWTGGFFPILAPPGTDGNGLGLNFNADEAALALAGTLQADRLIFFSDVPGVLKDGQVISRLTAADVENLSRTGVVSGGMIPKLKSAVGALQAGIGAVYIASYGRAGDIGRVLGEEIGTGVF